MTVSPAVAGYFQAKKSRRQSPATNAATEFQKIRFIGGTHLTIEQRLNQQPRIKETEATRHVESSPCLTAELRRFHEGTPTYFLRRGARPLAPHAPGAGNLRRSADPVARLFFRHYRGGRGASCGPATGPPSGLPRVENQT